jgi:hypothetical protein
MSFVSSSLTGNAMSDEDSNSGGSHDGGVEYDESVPPILETHSARRVPGSARGSVKVAADFDATPDDFEEYTQ